MFKHKIWQRIQDGETEWKPMDASSEALDLFEVEVVAPLRELRDEGRIELEEIASPAPGRYRVTHIFLKRILRP